MKWKRLHGLFDTIRKDIHMTEKYERLKSTLAEMESVLVAYSGGVDSTFLMRVAHDILGDRAVAVLASSETYPASEIEDAKSLAAEMGVRLINIHTEELRNEEFARNSPDRCYHCKMELFSKLKQIAADEGLNYLLHGANADDLGDYRPGQRAAQELGARAPLQEIGFTKAEIRSLSEQLGLPTWDKPSFACLSSRFPYGTRITPGALTQIDASERLLHELGFRQVRVRHHGTIARIEVESSELDRLMQPETRVRAVEGIKNAGYTYVTIDLEGYRTGSMNETL